MDDTSAILSPDGCPYFHAGTFGGDAGGDANGKDHLWRYYEPSRVTWNGCVAIGKPATREVVKVGDVFQYKIKFYNAGTLDLTNVVVRDTLPGGVQFISAFPAQDSGPNPLVWNVGSLLRGQKFETTVTVKATGTGALENIVTVTSEQLPPQTVTEITLSGSIPILKQSKSVTPTSVAPGGTVQYTVLIENIGSGPSGSPVEIHEYLPSDFTYVSLDSVTVNGVNVTGSTAVDSTNPSKPIFTVPFAINAGSELALVFTAQTSVTIQPGPYRNSYTSWQNDLPLTTGAQACVSVGGGKIGDTIFRDWNGDGVQDLVDEGVEGVSVDLYQDVDGDGTYETFVGSATTDANGKYLFEGLVEGNYRVVVTDTAGKLSGYTLTADPDGGVANQADLTLGDGQQRYDIDFGYQPGGAGVIGDTVWKDDGTGGGIMGNGIQDGTEPGIANVTVWLYEDTNGNYSFTGLAEGINYLVDVDEADPNLIAAVGTPTASSTEDPIAVPNLTGTYGLADLGYYQVPPATINGTVFGDENGDGNYDAGIDNLLPDVEVYLYEDLNGNGVLDPGEPAVASTTTDANGDYSFTNLPPGDYVVDVAEGDPDVPDGYVPSTDEIAVSLAEGETRDNVDFPFVQLLRKEVNLTSASGGDTYNLTYYSNQGYTVTVYVNGVVTDVVPNLGPGESVAISVTIEIPPTALEHTLDTTTIIATSITDGTVLDTAHDYTSIRPMIGGIINPDPLEILVEVGTTVYFVQDWQNLANRDDRANITVFDIPLDWGVTVYRDPTTANTVGVYTGGLNQSGWVWVATEYTTDSDDILDNNDNVNPAADTGSDGVPDSDDLGPTGSPTSTTQVILEVTIPADAAPGTYTLRERGSSNNDWVEKKAITPTLAYNDDSIYHDDTFKIVEIASEEATVVDLHRFCAHPAGNQIIVEWETATEIDTIGFNVTRAESRDGPWIQLNDSLIPSKSPGGIIGASYEFVDDTAVPGITYYYCLDDIDTQGVITSHRHRLAVAAIPMRIYLPMLHK